jgi:hypothetical protein
VTPDGCPDETELQRVREWPYADLPGLLEFVHERWSYPDYWREEGDVLHASTGGWSGNESLIDALQENRMFWALCWISSRRGGHFEFDLKRARGAA